MVDDVKQEHKFGEFEAVITKEGQTKTVVLREDAITYMKENGHHFNFNNFTRKCYHFAQLQDFSDTDFSYLLEWWLQNANKRNKTGIHRFLVDENSMDKDDPWLENRHYRFFFDGFKDLIKKNDGYTDQGQGI